MTTALVTMAGKLAERLGMDAGSDLVGVLKATAFSGEATDAQFTALLIVANQYGLNPFTKEIYAFPDKQNGIVPVVGVDGWARIINEHPQFDGMEFVQDAESCTCKVYRKDRNHPISVTEWMDECKREAFKSKSGYEVKGPWQSHPKRMLRHKAMIQCARLAFGFAGIYDKDEAERVISATTNEPWSDMHGEQSNERDISPASSETLQSITDLLTSMNKTWEDLYPICSQTFRRPISSANDITEEEAIKARGFLAAKAKVAA
ncbi:phage recombination protein Bet [Serratia sp. UGAL515B_01]|uniref:phage recombination protein Bet n=1 Tax=Serratia sp. UGAL515B_01 TaxID=2986763 RepID=UPI0029558436|nr:phage recombination protein Bet [Serratia sp. UGAL515B_01]WON77543.1 phage recombination protein Bet [Serratia sp. UGAL515B_01]